MGLADCCSRSSRQEAALLPRLPLQVAANTNLEALSLLFCGLMYHSTALQPLSQLQSLQSLNIGWVRLPAGDATTTGMELS